MGTQGIILPSGVSASASSIKGASVGTSVECLECSETFTKSMPGLNICGTCQVVWAIIMFHKEQMAFRWGLPRFKVTMNEDGTWKSFERIEYPWEKRRTNGPEEQAEG